MLKVFAFAALMGLGLQAAAAPVAVLQWRGAISPASSAYLSAALPDAAAKKAVLVVLKLDTPGGLDSAMREMIQDILASPVPVAIYVAPSGARAASAGTYLLYASHVAAMAPGTNLGAATPVPIGIGPGAAPAPLPQTGDRGGRSPETPMSPGEAEATKVVQDAAAYLRGLAQLRGRNAEWAEAAVTHARSLSAEEALRLRVIDVIAEDVPDLLAKLDGRSIRTATGTATLHVRDAMPYEVQPDWKSRALAVIADPRTALTLMMLGIYGLLFEFFSPGLAFPGVGGAICLLLAAYGLHLLPVSYVGVLLVILGAAFMISEAFFPTFGALGIGGVAAFAAGALMLMEPNVPGLEVTWMFVAPLTLISAAVLFAIGAMAVRAMKRPAVAGTDAMIGQVVEAVEDFDHSGWVRVQGEYWRALTPQPMKKGQAGRIVRTTGVTLQIEPLAEGKATDTRRSHVSPTP